MGSGGKSRIGLLGFKPVQRQVIQSICSLSEARENSYIVAGDNEALQADLLLVDAESLESVDRWQTECADANARTLFIGDLRVDGATHQIKRSQLAGQLLNVLDDINITAMAVSGVGQVAGAIGRPAVLIIDDSLSVRTQMTLCLEDFNLEVVSVDSAESGIELLSSRKIDIIFLDVMLPGINGYDACSRIKKTAGGKDLPVVLLTSKSSPFNKVRGVMAGCDRYLTKPADVKDVATVITHFLGDSIVSAASKTLDSAATA